MAACGVRGTVPGTGCKSYRGIVRSAKRCIIDLTMLVPELQGECGGHVEAIIIALRQTIIVMMSLSEGIGDQASDCNIILTNCSGVKIRSFLTTYSDWNWIL